VLERKVVDAEYLLKEAPREKKFIIGNEAVSEAIKRANVDIGVSYPITPQSEAMHLVGDIYAQGYLKDYYRAEHELGAMSAISGAAMAGVRTFTATSGPGTLRAFEMFPTWAGARLPVVCAFMCRGINSPLTIQPDNIEMGWLMDTGMMIFHGENPQEFFDMILQSFMIAEQPDVHIPAGVCVDGFFVTHTREVVELPPEGIMLPPYDPYSAPVPVMDMEKPPIRHMRDPFVMKSNYISYATHASWQQEVHAAKDRARKHIAQYMGDSVIVTHKDADLLIIASGTAAAQSRVAMEAARKLGLDVGLLKVKVIKPFPEEEIRQLTRKAKAIIVPELNIIGWLAREVKLVSENKNIYGGPRVFGGMTMPPEAILEEIKKIMRDI
jgi:pyruvate ferredoxin oxidoreductase alpha subunit